MFSKYVVVFGFGLLCGAGIVQTREANLIGILLIGFGLLFLILQGVIYGDTNGR